jgi:hypothetical protein
MRLSSRPSGRFFYRIGIELETMGDSGKKSPIPTL